MKLLALEIEESNEGGPDVEPILRDEARAVWELQQEGIVREAYFRRDRHTAVLVLECENVLEARGVLAALPLVKRGLISFDVIPLAPYSGFSRLFAGDVGEAGRLPAT